MKQPSNIPLVRTTNGEVLPGNPFSRVVLSSVGTNWRNLIVEEHRFASHELDALMYVQDVVAVNLGAQINCEYKKDGRFRYMSKPKNSIYLCPIHHPFHVFRRPQEADDEPADVLYVALDSVLVSQAAEDLGIYLDRFELVEQQRESDSALWYIVHALRTGMQNVNLGDALYGESLTAALTVHLLREYSERPIRRQQVSGVLPRAKLRRAVEYIHDQMSAELSVAAIARAVHMSRYHFTRLFKKATGLSPYRYVIEARARKAKELLSSGKFSIADVAHQVGFSDQSHMNRQIKAVFGVTPKALLELRDPKHNFPTEEQEPSRPIPPESANVKT